MYERMTGKFKRYISECLEHDQVEKLDDKINVPPIRFPDEEQSKESDEYYEGTRTKPD